MTPLQRLAAFIGPGRLLPLARFFPPFLGAGIRVRYAARDLSRVEVELPLTRCNRNVVGTQFGGSLYAMCDPFLMMMLMMRLGPDYYVWDRAATIDFIRPGRGKVSAVFELTDARVDAIRREAESGEKTLPRFDVNVVNESGETIARIEKIIYVRKKHDSQ
jgi:acyl-coenzyme A thioesterase PaaI-like protein